MKPALPLLVIVWLVSAAAADLPEPYQVIVQRNLFSPSRSATSSRSAAVVAEAPPMESVTLTGVVILDGQATALFAGTTPGLSGSRRPGNTLDNARLTAADTAGVSLDAGAAGGPIRLGIGQTLQRAAGQPWQAAAAGAAPVTAGTATPATGAAATPLTPAAATAPADAGDILKRMLERRQRELNP